MLKPTGVYPAIVTPYDKWGGVNEKELRKLISWLICQGVDGLTPLGTVGEFVHLKQNEKAKIFEMVVDEAAGRVPIIAGTTGSCNANCIDLSAMARDLGCQGALIGPPFYYPVTQEALEKHFEVVANALPNFPIILYNIPACSTPISVEIIRRLSSRLTNIVGLKDSSGCMINLLHSINNAEVAGGDFQVMVGREEMFYPALMVGSSGSITGAAGVVPELMVSLYNSWLKNNYEQALSIQLSILPLIRAMNTVPLPLGYKLALECRGFIMGEPKIKPSDTERRNYSKIKYRINETLTQILGENVLVK